MQKKKIEKITLTSLAIHMNALGESQRKTGVLLERLESKFDLLLEGYGAFNKRMDSMEARMDRLEKRMEEGFAEFNYKFEVVFKKLNEIDSTLARIITKVAI